MSQFPHDRFNKNLFELRLAPFGEINTQRPLDPETTFIDIYFVPRLAIPPEPSLNLLSQCIGEQAVAFEPYRNPVEIDKIQDCIVKSLQIQKANCPEPDPQASLKPRMWIITPTLAKPKLAKFGAVEASETGLTGMYLLPEALQTGIIIVHQLPVIPETLWFRLMGNGAVQQAAMAEVAALPTGHPERENTLNLLVSYRMELAAKQNPEPEEQELVMQLSPLYLEQLESSRQEGIAIGEKRGEQLGELKGRQDIVLKLLVRQIGQIPDDLEAQVKTLPLVELDSLVDDLLNFGQVGDLLQWLEGNRF
jgi:Domain of unknown function (DUF4351)